MKLGENTHIHTHKKRKKFWIYKRIIIKLKKHGNIEQSTTKQKKRKKKRQDSVIFGWGLRYSSLSENIAVEDDLWLHDRSYSEISRRIQPIQETGCHPIEVFNWKFASDSWMWEWQYLNLWDWNYDPLESTTWLQERNERKSQYRKKWRTKVTHI